MLNRSQMETIAMRLSEMSDGADDEHVRGFENLAFSISALPAGHDVDYLIGVIDSDEANNEPVRKAARFCLETIIGDSHV